MRATTEGATAMTFTQVDDPIGAVLTMLQTRREALDQLSAALVHVRDVFGQPIEVMLGRPPAGVLEAVPAPVAELPARSRSVPRRAATGRRPGRAPRDTAEVDAVVLAAVKAGASHGRAIAAKAKVHVLVARKALARLVATGHIEQHGKGRYNRFALPGKTPAPAPVSRRPNGDDARDAQVIAFLEQQARPVAPREIIAALGVSSVPMQQAIKRLVSRGAVIARGNTTTRQIGVPRVMGTAGETTPAPRATPTPTPAPAPTASPANARLEAEISRVLKSGASYDVREIRRNVLTAFPTISVDDITETCDAMARDGRVFRHVVGESGRRYQLRVRK